MAIGTHAFQDRRASLLDGSNRKGHYDKCHLKTFGSAVIGQLALEREDGKKPYQTRCQCDKRLAKCRKSSLTHIIVLALALAFWTFDNSLLAFVQLIFCLHELTWTLRARVN